MPPYYLHDVIYIGGLVTKRRDLVRELERAGFRAAKGTKHQKCRKGDLTVMVPRHSEIKDQLADAIRREAGLR